MQVLEGSRYNGADVRPQICLLGLRVILNDHSEKPQTQEELDNRAVTLA